MHTEVEALDLVKGDNCMKVMKHISKMKVDVKLADSHFLIQLPYQ